MKSFQRILSNLSFFIVVMLIFLLFFQQKINMPAWLQTVGRMHPLLLHVPIGILVLSFFLWLFRKNFEENTFQKLFTLVLHITAFTATLTALMGFFLSREEGYDAVLLQRHKTFGVIAAILSYLLLLLYQAFPGKKRVYTPAFLITLVILILGAHFGANLTHGEGYVLQPLRGSEEEKNEPVTDSSTLFTAAIKPILKSKCFSCHNERKAKGKLVMTSEEKLLEGGKNGPVWVAGDPLNSHIIQNIHLPVEDKKHMPPEGKPQLSAAEIEFLYAWIEAGADLKKMLRDYADTDSLKILASKFIKAPQQQEVAEKKYEFEAASASVIKRLNDPFRSVFPLSLNSPALQANFFVRQNFDRKKLEELLSVKDQLVVLNLSDMPVTDADVKTISKFNNLEKLVLNNTDITNKAIEELKSLKKLHALSIAGTKVNKEAANYFLLIPLLKEVFVWNSGITQSEAAEMQQKNKNIVFNSGYVADKNEILKLNPPVLKNENFVLTGEEKIVLSHPLPGAGIRFTTDGAMPDSINSAEYTSPVVINSYTVLKTRAVKPGWYSSDVGEYYFFKKGTMPQRAELINPANEKYTGQGAQTLIDGKKGEADNFKDAAWLGFREQPFAGKFYFDQPPMINSITISYGKNTGAYIVPPVLIQIWGGEDEKNLKLLKRFVPEPVTKEQMGIVRVEGVKVEIPPSQFKCYKIEAKNMAKLPPWHPGKGEKGWLFIDEIFFN